MGIIDKQLKELYNSKINELEKTNFSDFAGPLLMGERAKNYDLQKHKILFIGKEPNGWMDDTLDVDFLMEEYKSKNLSSTNIWRYMFDFHNNLNPDYKDQFEFFWTNISKFCKYDGTSVSNDVFINLYPKFNVLKEEVKIINPDVVIVFSYDIHDNWLHWQFDDEINWNQIDGFGDSELMRLSHTNLPKNTFRTYHPDYLNRNPLLKKRVLKKLLPL